MQPLDPQLTAILLIAFLVLDLLAAVIAIAVTKTVPVFGVVIVAANVILLLLLISTGRGMPVVLFAAQLLVLGGPIGWMVSTRTPSPKSQKELSEMDKLREDLKQ